MKKDVWSTIPQKPFEQFINEGWTSPELFLEHCLYGPSRIITSKMIYDIPTIYVCNACGRKSLHQITGCASREVTLDFPSKDKVFFVDADMIIYLPPKNSSVWSRLQLQPDDDSLPVPEQAQVQAPPPESAEPRLPAPLPASP